MIVVLGSKVNPCPFFGLKRLVKTMCMLLRCLVSPCFLVCINIIKAKVDLGCILLLFEAMGLEPILHPWLAIVAKSTSFCEKKI